MSGAVVVRPTWQERREQEVAGPYTVWTDYGCEGWQPESYQTLEEAVNAPRYGSNAVIMKPVKIDYVDKTDE